MPKTETEKQIYKIKKSYQAVTNNAGVRLDEIAKFDNKIEQVRVALRDLVLNTKFNVVENLEYSKEVKDLLNIFELSKVAEYMTEKIAINKQIIAKNEKKIESRAGDSMSLEQENMNLKDEIGNLTYLINYPMQGDSVIKGMGKEYPYLISFTARYEIVRILYAVSRMLEKELAAKDPHLERAIFAKEALPYIGSIDAIYEDNAYLMNEFFTGNPEAHANVSRKFLAFIDKRIIPDVGRHLEGEKKDSRAVRSFFAEVFMNPNDETQKIDENKSYKNEDRLKQQINRLLNQSR